MKLLMISPLCFASLETDAVVNPAWQARRRPGRQNAFFQAGRQEIWSTEIWSTEIVPSGTPRTQDDGADTANSGRVSVARTHLVGAAELPEAPPN